MSLPMKNLRIPVFTYLNNTILEILIISENYVYKYIWKISEMYCLSN